MRLTSYFTLVKKRDIRIRIHENVEKNLGVNHSPPWCRSKIWISRRGSEDLRQNVKWLSVGATTFLTVDQRKLLRYWHCATFEVSHVEAWARENGRLINGKYSSWDSLKIYIFVEMSQYGLLFVGYCPDNYFSLHEFVALKRRRSFLFLIFFTQALLMCFWTSSKNALMHNDVLFPFMLDFRLSTKAPELSFCFRKLLSCFWSYLQPCWNLE